jgi:ferredoxin--NADP+ reductase
MTSQVAIVGAGPSGFYTAEAVLAVPQARVTLLEQLPFPGGLVRYGVAPDHLALRRVGALFERIAQNQRLTFIGNTAVPTDVTLEALLETHHAVVLATGAPQPLPLALPGSDCDGVYSAAQIVGWYNGHPDHAEFEPSFGGGSVCVLGHGNVAADIARVLLSGAGRLAKTDITQSALDALEPNPVHTVHLVGRRGPAETRFSAPILKELMALSDLQVVLDPQDLSAAHCQEGGAETLTIFRDALHHRTAAARRQLHFHFNCSLDQIAPRDGRLAVRYRKPAGAAAQRAALLVDRVVCATGFQVRPIHHNIGTTRGLISNHAGQVLTHEAVTLPRVYAAGWAAHGARGTIGMWREPSRRLVRRLMDDLLAFSARPAAGAAALLEQLERAGHSHTSLADWRLLDTLERQSGERCTKPREKFRRARDMLTALRCHASAASAAAKDSTGDTQCQIMP